MSYMPEIDPVADLDAYLDFDPESALIDLDRHLVATGGLSAFMRLAWPIIEGGSVYKPNWHIDAISEHLMAVSTGEIRRLVIAIPPRHMKSLSAAVMYPAYDWIKRPWRRFLFASYGHTLSIRDSVKCRRVIQSSWYQKRWGHRFKLTGDQNTKIRFENDQNGYRIATSVDGVATGEGADVIVIDDAHNVRKAESEKKRESTLNWWDEAMSSRLNDPEKGAYVLIGQRVHEKDLTGHVLRKASSLPYTVLCLPAEFEPDHPQRWFRDPRKEAGELLWPSRFGAVALKELKDSLGPYACTPAESPILMADLSLRPISEVRVGDKIIGFSTPERRDGDPRNYRRQHLVHAEVKSVYTYVAPVVRMTLDSGRVIRCTRDHKWFRKLRGPTRPAYLPAQVGTKLARVCPPELPVLSYEDQREAGWLSGFFDGEGSVSNCRKFQNGEQLLDYRASASITYYQGAGRNLPLCQRLEAALTRFGFAFHYGEDFRQDRSANNTYGYRQYRLIGNDLTMYQRFMHIVQPHKWPDRIINAALGAKFITQRETVVSIEPDGEETVFALETTTGNYVVWGLASSNSAAQLQQRPAPREGGIFKRRWFSKIQVIPADTVFVRGWDNAASEKTLIKTDPDYTAGVKVGYSPSAGYWIIANVTRFRLEPQEVEKEMKRTAEADGIECEIQLAQDPGSAGRKLAQDQIRMLSKYSVYADPVSGDKMARALTWAGKAGIGLVKLLDADWNEDFLSELCSFPTGAHDDQVDACSSAFDRLLNNTMGILSFMEAQLKAAGVNAAALRTPIQELEAKRAAEEAERKEKLRTEFNAAAEAARAAVIAGAEPDIDALARAMSGAPPRA